MLYTNNFWYGLLTGVALTLIIALCAMMFGW